MRVASFVVAIVCVANALAAEPLRKRLWNEDCNTVELICKDGLACKPRAVGPNRCGYEGTQLAGATCYEDYECITKKCYDNNGGLKAGHCIKTHGETLPLDECREDHDCESGLCVPPFVDEGNIDVEAALALGSCSFPAGSQTQGDTCVHDRDCGELTECNGVDVSKKPLKLQCHQEPGARDKPGKCDLPKSVYARLGDFVEWRSRHNDENFKQSRGLYNQAQRSQYIEVQALTESEDYLGTYDLATIHRRFKPFGSQFSTKQQVARFRLPEYVNNTAMAFIYKDHHSNGVLFSGDHKIHTVQQYNRWAQDHGGHEEYVDEVHLFTPLRKEGYFNAKVALLVGLKNGSPCTYILARGTNDGLFFAHSFGGSFGVSYRDEQRFSSTPWTQAVAEYNYQVNEFDGGEPSSLSITSYNPGKEHKHFVVIATLKKAEDCTCHPRDQFVETVARSCVLRKAFHEAQQKFLKGDPTLPREHTYVPLLSQGICAIGEVVGAHLEWTTRPTESAEACVFDPSDRDYLTPIPVTEELPNVLSEVTTLCDKVEKNIMARYLKEVRDDFGGVYFPDPEVVQEFVSCKRECREQEFQTVVSRVHLLSCYNKCVLTHLPDSILRGNLPSRAAEETPTEETPTEETPTEAPAAEKPAVADTTTTSALELPRKSAKSVRGKLEA